MIPPPHRFAVAVVIGGGDVLVAVIVQAAFARDR